MDWLEHEEAPLDEPMLPPLPPRSPRRKASVVRESFNINEIRDDYVRASPLLGPDGSPPDSPRAPPTFANPRMARMSQTERQLMATFESLDHDACYDRSHAVAAAEEARADRMSDDVASWATFGVIGVATAHRARDRPRGRRARRRAPAAARALDGRRRRRARARTRLLAICLARGCARRRRPLRRDHRGGLGIPEVRATSTASTTRASSRRAGPSPVGIIFAACSGPAIGREGRSCLGAVLGNVAAALPAQQARRPRRGARARARRGRACARSPARGPSAARRASSTARPRAAPASAPAAPRPKRRPGAARTRRAARAATHRRSGIAPTGHGERDRAHQAAHARGAARRYPWWYRFRDDRSKRDFVTGGAAAGVAGAFATPTGGICFALEEASTAQWPPSLMARVFLCTMLSTFTLWTLTAVRENDKSFQGFVKFGSFLQGAARYELWEVPLMVVPALALGALGAAFCRINARLSRWRRQHVLGRPARRVVEVLLVVALTATVMFWLPVMLDECRPTGAVFECGAFDNGYYCGHRQPRKWPEIGPGMRPTSCNYTCPDISVYERWRCDDGEYSAAATLAMAPAEQTIKALFHDQDAFSAAALVAYACAAFALAVLTYGIAVPSGLFVPCILIGGALGRLWGEWLRATIGQGVDGGVAIQPGIYAVVGAAAMLSSVTRITITLVVILYETTNELYLITPIMAAVLVAKWVADRWSVSVYDLHIELKCIPLIKHSPPRELTRLVARDVMAAPVVTLRSIEHVGELAAVLDACAHNGFPVTRGGDAPSVAASKHAAAIRRSIGSATTASSIAASLAAATGGGSPLREMPPHPYSDDAPDGAGVYVGIVLRHQLVTLIRHRMWHGARRAACAADAPDGDASGVLQPTDVGGDSDAEPRAAAPAELLPRRVRRRSRAARRASTRAQGVAAATAATRDRGAAGRCARRPAAARVDDDDDGGPGAPPSTPPRSAGRARR